MGIEVLSSALPAAAATSYRLIQPIEPATPSNPTDAELELFSRD